jgi:hypothetical protein
MLIKKGQKFQVVGVNRNGHSYYTGIIYEALKDDTGNGTTGTDDRGYRGNTITAENYQVLPITRDDITKEISDLEKKHKKEIDKLQAQLAYLDESKKEEYDEMEHKCYQAIKSLSSTASDVEKAMLISRLVKGDSKTGW